MYLKKARRNVALCYCYNSNVMSIDKQSKKKSLPFNKLNAPLVISETNNTSYLDTNKLNKMEKVFRGWVEKSVRADIRISRIRILLIFLLIRYTGAKLNEILNLDISKDFDFARSEVILGRRSKKKGIFLPRRVLVPKSFINELKVIISSPILKKYSRNLFRIDPAHIRRKFYEVSLACGFKKSMGAPEIIRKSRAIELVKSNVPLPVVQRILGHSTMNLTASYINFSNDEIQQLARYFIEKESYRKTSARNSFFGKILSIQKGDIQSKIEMVTISGNKITTIITNDSLAKLNLSIGSLIIAEIKAPWVIIEKSNGEPQTTAENRFSGIVTRITEGKITTEFVVRIKDGTELCSIVSTEIAHKMKLNVNDNVWVLFSSYAVVLHID